MDRHFSACHRQCSKGLASIHLNARTSLEYTIEKPTLYTFKYVSLLTGNDLIDPSSQRVQQDRRDDVARARHNVGLSKSSGVRLRPEGPDVSVAGVGGVAKAALGGGSTVSGSRLA